MKSKEVSFVQMAQRIPAREGDSLLTYDPEKPKLQVGLPDNKAQWVQSENIGEILSNAFTSTTRK